MNSTTNNLFHLRVDNYPFLNTSCSPNEIRAVLVEKGVLPTPAEAKNVFWSLGDNWWKQIIDGAQHRHGSLVFDQGLHGGHIEPGYLKGLENASLYFTNSFDQELSIQLYKEIHHQACLHFDIMKQEINGVRCHVCEIDEFRTQKEQCAGCPIRENEYVQLNTRLYQIQKVKQNLSDVLPVEENKETKWAPEILEAMRQYGISTEPKSAEDLQKDLEKAVTNAKFFLGLEQSTVSPQELMEILSAEEEKLYKPLQEMAEAAVNNLEKHFALLAEKHGAKHPYVSCFLRADRKITILYEPCPKYEFFFFEDITKKIISEFNQNLNDLQRIAFEKIQCGNEKTETIKKDYQEAVIPLIAQLFAELEWAHPWIDGQGRTDLILLNGLLCREGLHPCILNQPYFSSSNRLELWVDYLKDGLDTYVDLKK